MTSSARHPKKVQTRTHPHDLDLDEDELLGMVTNISVPRGHLDDSITLIIPPREDNL